MMKKTLSIVSQLINMYEAPAPQEDVFGLFNDFLQESLGLLQRADLCFVVGHGSRQPQALVAERSAGRMGHHHRTQRLLVELQHTQMMMRQRKSAPYWCRLPVTCVYLSYQLVEVVF